METLERQLTFLMANRAPSTHDPAFNLGVMARIEKRRVHRELMRHLLIALAAGTILFLLSPGLDTTLQVIHENVLETLWVIGTALFLMQWSLDKMEA